MLHYLFYCPNCSNFGHWEIFRWLLVPFKCPVLFLDHFLTFWHYKIFPFILVFSALDLGSAIVLENGIRSQHRTGALTAVELSADITHACTHV